MKTTYFQKIIDLGDSVIRRFPPRMKWMWGEALLGYALTELDAFLKEERYFDFTRAYCDYWAAADPRVDQSDTSAPALITYAMEKRTGNPAYAALTEKVLNYIKHEPRILDDAVNHLGNSPESRLYPRSIWVDSLMMFSVFPSRYAAEKGDRELLDFAARQPRLYSGYMQDREDHLWYHCYWVKAHSHYPRKKIYWGRGNGWVIASLPLILDYLPGDHPEREGIMKILRSTSHALLPYQREDGYWETVFNRRGKTYRESSATMLIAAGWLKAVHKEYLPRDFLAPAVRAFRAVVNNFEYRDGEIYMPEISAPTIALPLLPYTGYRFTPRGNNWSYGLAAAIMAGINYQTLADKGLIPEGGE